MPPPIDIPHVLESVLTIWREAGYQRATMRNIAVLSGVSEMTLFRRFGDKAALFRAALELEAERFTEQALEHTGSIEDDLEQIVRAYSELLERSAPIILDFLLEAPRNPELARIRAVPQGAIAKVAMTIIRYQSDGQLRAGSPFAVLISLLGPLVMAALVTRAQPGMLPPPDPADRVRDFLLGWGTVL
jgi:AcrR family transcriptional regulator